MSKHSDTMEKGDLKRIRNAVREYAQEEKINYREALDLFRQLKVSHGENTLADAITGLSGIREVRERIDEDLYGIYKLVATEKEKKAEALWEEQIREIENLPSAGEQLAALFKSISKSVDICQEEIRTDKRIEEVFKGKEADLDTLISVQKTWQKAMYKTLIFEAVGNENPQ